MVEATPQRQRPTNETDPVDEIVNAPEGRGRGSERCGEGSKPLPQLLDFFVQNFIFAGDGLLDREQEQGVEESPEDLRKVSVGGGNKDQPWQRC
jgi:hypothetical protein